LGRPYFRAYARATWEEGGVLTDLNTTYIPTEGEDYMEYAKGGIHIKPENKGKFTAWAKSHGMGVQEAASHVMANKEDYSPTIVKRANFAKNAAGWKHYHGGLIHYPEGGKSWSDFSSEEILNTDSPVSVGYTGPKSFSNVSTLIDESKKLENIQPVKKAMIKNPSKSQSFQPLDSDAQAIYEEKKKNPAWKNFKGNYIIYSKENSMLNLFDNKHNLIGQTRAGRGVGEGDTPNLANPNDWYDSSKPKKGQEKRIKAATTPAGAYAIKESPMDSENYGTKVYEFGKPNPYNAITAMHGVYKGDFYNRTKIINDPNIKQAFVSNGCLNIPAKFLNKYDNEINTGDSLFITKEPVRKFAPGGLIPPYSNKRQYMFDYLGGKTNESQIDLDFLNSNQENPRYNNLTINPINQKSLKPNVNTNFGLQPEDANLNYTPITPALGNKQFNYPNTFVGSEISYNYPETYVGSQIVPQTSINKTTIKKYRNYWSNKCRFR